MGRKKRKGVELKPFCFYCDRDFDDEKVLIQHQKAKHFKCTQCNRKLDTATGLVVHMLQVHKDSINKVPNSLTGRDNPEMIIHGMEGVPHEMIVEKQQKAREAIGVRDAKKQERVSWTQVQMAPTMQQFMNQMQQNGAPGGGARLPPVGMMPTLPGMPAMPFPPPFPGMPAFPGLPMPGQVGGPSPFPPVPGMQNGMRPVGIPGLLPGQFPGMTQNPNMLPPGGSPIVSQMAPQACSQTTSAPFIAATPTVSNGTPSGPPPTPTIVPLVLQNMQATAHVVGHGLVPPGPPPQAVPPTKPANVKLIYDDDVVSPEERRASVQFGYRIKESGQK